MTDNNNDLKKNQNKFFFELKRNNPAILVKNHFSLPFYSVFNLNKKIRVKTKIR